MKDVEKVKVYHVDEYCEGANSFYFSERKDVVLLEDYKKLQDENKQLKAVAELFFHDLDLVADCYTIRLEECPEGFIDANGSPICAEDVARELKEEW